MQISIWAPIVSSINICKFFLFSTEHFAIGNFLFLCTVTFIQTFCFSFTFKDWKLASSPLIFLICLPITECDQIPSFHQFLPFSQIFYYSSTINEFTALWWMAPFQTFNQDKAKYFYQNFWLNWNFFKHPIALFGQSIETSVNHWKQSFHTHICRPMSLKGVNYFGDWDIFFFL